MSNPHVVKCEDGSILIEWIFEGARFFISLESNPAESGWGYVTMEIAECGELPEILSTAAEREERATMTDEQLRRIDALVARELGLELGACPCDPEHDIREVDGWWWECVRCGTGGYINRKGFATDIAHVIPCPHYTTSTEAAFEAVDWMREQGWEFWLYWEPSDFGEVWGVAFMYYTDDPADHQHHWAEAETRGLAICLAFLRARGVNVEEER